MALVREWRSKRTFRTVAATAALLLALVLMLPARALAGTFHVYSCRTPTGESAPTDGWSGFSAGAKSHALDTCSSPNGALISALDDRTQRLANVDIATWSLGLPSGEALAGATLWRAGDADGGFNTNGGYEYTIAGPGQTSYFESCIAFANCEHGKGDVSQPLSPNNKIPVLSPHLGQHLYVSATCEGNPGEACPEGAGDPNHYAAVIYLYAADLTLEQTAAPSASNVGGELASASTITGTSDLTFNAGDPGAGVYQAVISVDGQVVRSTVVNENGGRCRNVGQTSDGTAAFLYLQPCPASASANVSLDTTKIANGAHHVVVEVTDAAGNSTPVIDRQLIVYNPPAPGAPGPANGTNASSSATLAVRWKSTVRSHLGSSFGVAHTITGRLTTASNLPIAGARIELLATPSMTGARTLTMTAPTTDADGRFTVQLARGVSSSTLRFLYRAHFGDPIPAASGALTLAVRTGIAMTIAPRIASAGSSIHFHGRLLGGPVPGEGKQIVLEARSPGGPWIEFRVVRTNARGAFRAAYRFRFPGPARYLFRARSEPESDYPFAAGASATVAVGER